MSAGYDAAALELELEFRSGHVYRYTGVPASVFEWLLRTPNKGGFVRRMVTGRYPEHAVRSSATAASPGSGPGQAAALEGSLEDALRASIERLKPIGPP